MTRRLPASSGLVLGAAVAVGGLLLIASPHPDVAAVCLLGVLCLALWLLVSFLVPEPNEVQFLSWVLFSTILLRFVLAVVQHYVWPALGYALQADALAILAAGRDLAAEWAAGLSKPALPADLTRLHDWLHVYRSAVLFRYFGYSPLLPEATNIVLSASSALAGYLVVRRWSGVRAARLAALLVAFWPSLMVWSSHNLKDPVNMAALCWSTYGILLLRDRVSVQALAMVVAGWVSGFLIRPYMGVLMIAGQMAAVGLVVMRARTAAGRYFGGVLTLGLAALSLYVGNQQINEMYGEAASLQVAEAKRQSFYEGAATSRAAGETHSEYVVNLQATSTAGALLQLPLRIPLFLLSPIPVRFGSARLMATYPEMLFLYWLIPGFVLGFRRVWAWRWEEALFVLCAIAPICIVFSIGTSISGEAMRYRDIILPALLLFAAVGWAARLEAREERARGAESRRVVRAARHIKGHLSHEDTKSTKNG